MSCWFITSDTYITQEMRLILVETFVAWHLGDEIHGDVVLAAGDRVLLTAAFVKGYQGSIQLSFWDVSYSFDESTGCQLIFAW